MAASSVTTYNNPGLYLCGRPRGDGSVPAQLSHNNSWIHLAPISNAALSDLIAGREVTVRDSANNEFHLNGRATFYCPAANKEVVPLQGNECDTIEHLNETLKCWRPEKQAETLSPPETPKAALAPPPAATPRQIPYRLIFGGLFAASLVAASYLAYANKAEIHLWLNETIAIDAKLTSIGEGWTEWTTRLGAELSQLPSWSELFSRATANTDSTLPLGAD